MQCHPAFGILECCCIWCVIEEHTAKAVRKVFVDVRDMRRGINSLGMNGMQHFLVMRL